MPVPWLPRLPCRYTGSFANIGSPVNAVTPPNADDVTVRSTFVTVVAWLFIVGSAAFTLIVSFQLILVFVLVRTRIEGADLPEYQPWLLGVFMRHPLLVVGSFWFIAVATLITSVGLLRRKNWARLGIIALLGLGVMWNVAGGVLMFMIPSPHALPPEAAVVKMAIMGGSLLFVCIVCALLIWIMVRLLSRSTRAEFLADSGAHGITR